MEFRNSLFEEKLYKVSSQKELSLFIKNHKYLIRDHISLSVNLMEQYDRFAKCIFLKDYLLNGETAVFRADSIYPDMFSYGAIQNIYILPLVFDKRVYGFMTIGYAGPELYTRHAKVFANRLAIGAEILNVRQQLPPAEETRSVPAQTDVAPTVSEVKTPSATILVMHNSSMTKVHLENVLYFESYEKKVFAAMKNGKYEIKQRLFELEKQLTHKNFFRISRSVLVNMDKTVGYKVEPDRSILAVMSDREELRVSRTNKEEFKQRLKRA